MFIQEPTVIERYDILRYFELVGVVLILLIRVLLGLPALYDVSGAYSMDVVSTRRRPLYLVQILVQ